jgi:hypothetical protein
MLWSTEEKQSRRNDRVEGFMDQGQKTVNIRQSEECQNSETKGVGARGFEVNKCDCGIM